MPDKVKEKEFQFGLIAGGLSFFSYQIAFGFSLRWWSDLKTPALRIYLGPFKLWVYLRWKEIRTS